MDAGILSSVASAGEQLWNWAAAQDPRIAFGAGLVAWFVAERAMAQVSGVLGKLLVLFAVAVLLAFGAALYVEAAKSWAQGETVPLESKVKSPNADYFAKERR